MFIKPRNKLSIQLDRALDALDNLQPGTTDYDDVIETIASLTKVEAEQAKTRLSKDAVLGAATSLGGILMIVAYENKHVITSKALSFVTKR